MNCILRETPRRSLYLSRKRVKMPMEMVKMEVQMLTMVMAIMEKMEEIQSLKIT